MKWPYSIRTLLVLITGAAIAIATYSKLASIVHQEQAAVARIEQHNGKVTERSAWVLSRFAGDRVSAVTLLIPPRTSGTDYYPANDLRWIHGLRELSIESMDGSVDDLNGVASVTRELRKLRISGFSLSIVPIATRFQNLESLSLHHSKLSPRELDALFLLKFLEHLSLSSTNIGDEHLSTIGRIKTLKSLDLSSTLISGESLNDLRSLNSLRILTVSKPKPAGGETKQLLEFLRQNFAGSDKSPATSVRHSGKISLTKLPIFESLATLALGRCTIDAEAIEAICQQPKLTEVSLFDCDFDTALSKSDFANWAIRFLVIENCKNVGNVIENLSNTHSLETFSIVDSKLGFADLRPIAGLPKLRRLVLQKLKNDSNCEVLCSFENLESTLILGTNLSQRDRQKLERLSNLRIDGAFPAFDR